MQPSLKSMRLPADRVEQLRQFADAIGGGTLSEAMGQLFKLAREQGLIEHNIPSVQINRFPDGIAIALRDGQTEGLSFGDATMIADQLRECVNGTDNGRKSADREPDSEAMWLVYRQGGTAVGLAIPAASEPRLFSLDLALELADLLEATAKDHL